MTDNSRKNNLNGSKYYSYSSLRNRKLIAIKKEIIENHEGIEELLRSINSEGCYLWKVRSNSKWYRRKFNLSLDEMRVKYEPSYKNNCFSPNSASNSSLEISNITEVRLGWKTDTFNKFGAVEERKIFRQSSRKRSVDEKCCFSIFYTSNDEENKNRVLDLVAQHSKVAEKWVQALQTILSFYELKKQIEGYDIWLRKKFNAADINNDKSLSFPEIVKLLKDLNIEMSSKEAWEIFNSSNLKKLPLGTETEEKLDETEFVDFYFKLLKRPEIDEIYSKYANQSGIWTQKELHEFLITEQGKDFEKITLDDCLTLVNIYEDLEELKEKGSMSVIGLKNMLLSTDFEIFSKNCRKVYQDMTQPLAHYFISSSHNTYLTGNQLSGKTSVEGYVSALKRGCRCLEIDCWDGEGNEPVVWHGHTLTNKIPLKEVLNDAIKPFAFVSSEYPLILSVENHCSFVQEIKMAAYFSSILGDFLYTEEVDENMENLPSPQDLKFKILIKGKVPNSSVHKSKISKVTKYIKNKTETSCIIKTKREKKKDSLDAAKNHKVNENDSSDIENKIREIDEKGDIKLKNKIEPSSSNYIASMKRHLEKREELLYNSSRVQEKAEYENNLKLPQKNEVDESDAEISSDDESDEDEVVEKPVGDIIDGSALEIKSKKGEALKSVVNLIQAVKFTTFKDAEEFGKCYQMSSFAESKAMKFYDEETRKFIKYNKKQLSRIYPSPTRTLSSNFLPFKFWATGCQIVALNYQTEDVQNYLNTTWFQENGGCGYLLKPDFLRNSSYDYNPKEPFSKNSSIFKIKVISGQHLPKAPGTSEIIDPYVEVKLIELSQDVTISKFVTKRVQNNGFNPIWNENFEIKINCPEFAILFIKVKDYAQSGADMPLAYYAISLSAMTTGYRHIYLQSLKGVSLSPATLFVHITLESCLDQ